MTIPTPLSLEGVAFLTTGPQAALPVVNLSHSPVFLFPQHFALSGMTFYCILVHGPVHGAFQGGWCPCLFTQGQGHGLAFLSQSS